MSQLGGIAVVRDIKDLVPPVYLLPHRLRLIRTALGDNGFRGVRTVTSERAFQADMHHQMKPQGTPDFLPENIEAEGAVPQNPDALFGQIQDGEFISIEDAAGSTKYLVCHPAHRWALSVRSNTVLLCPVSPATAKKALKGADVIEVNAFASFV